MILALYHSHRCCVETQLRLSIVTDQAVRLLNGILKQLTILSSTVRTLQALHESSQQAQLAQRITSRGDLVMSLVLMYAAAKAHRTNAKRHCQRQAECWLQGLFWGTEICQWMGSPAVPAPRQWVCEVRRFSLFLLGWAVIGAWAVYTAVCLFREEVGGNRGMEYSTRSSGSRRRSCTAIREADILQQLLLEPAHGVVFVKAGTHHISKLEFQQEHPAWSEDFSLSGEEYPPSTASFDTCPAHDSMFSRAAQILASATEFAAQLLSTALVAHLSLYVPVHCAAVSFVGGSCWAWLLLHSVRFACMHVVTSTTTPATATAVRQPHFTSSPITTGPESTVWQPREAGSHTWVLSKRQPQSAAVGAGQLDQKRARQQAYALHTEACESSAAHRNGGHVGQAVALLLHQLVLPMAQGLLPFALEILIEYGIQAGVCMVVLVISHLCWQTLHRSLQVSQQCTTQ